MGVYITDYIDDPYIEKGVLKELLVSSSSEAEVVLVWHTKIDRAFIDSHPNLKGIVRYGVGFDNIDVEYAAERGIVFCNTPDYGTDEVSDTAIAMIMNIARGVSRYDYLCRNYNDGTWQENTLPGIKRNSEMTIGVIGAGRIGGSVLLKSKSLGFKIAFFDPYKERGHEKMLGSFRADSLEALLSISDIVSLHCPLNDDTRGLVDKNFINNMLPGASLINTARGELVDSLNNFIEPLQNGHLNCLALDVLPTEPPSEEERLIRCWQQKVDWLDGRLIINPHSAYFSEKAYTEMREKAASNALRIIKGQTPFNIIRSKNS